MAKTTYPGPLPFDHLISYLAVLSQLRNRKRRRISFNEFVCAFENLTPQTVRKEVSGLGIEVVGELDVDRAYWELFRAQTAAENSVQQANAVTVVAPEREELVQVLQKCLSNTNALCDNIDQNKVADAVIAIDAAYDYAAEKPEFFVLGHGRMAPGKVAFVHQIGTCKRLLEDMGGAALVADEVGLGKTIVAGLVIEETRARISDHSVLILVPPNLRRQWSEKLVQFFGLTVATDRGPLSYEQLSRARVLLLSLDNAKGKKEVTAVRDILLRRKWDLLVVDEAHECRNEDSIRHKFVFSLCAATRLFLTATPVQNSGYDIYSLANLLLPGFFGQKVVFTERHMATERTLKNSLAIQDQLSSLILRTLRKDTGGIPFAEREKPIAVRVNKFKKEEKEIYDQLLTILRGVYNRHLGSSAKVRLPSGRESHVSQFVLVAMLVLREMASHPRAALGTLQLALRERVLEMAQLSRDDSELTNLDAFIERYTKQEWDRAHHAKSERLVELVGELIDSGRRCVIYVNYHITHDIVSKLVSEARSKADVLGYHGKLSQDRKDKVLEAFRNEPGACLISTDCGGQGLDMEFADTVINYDFPWNPMRLEQRIGRIDRFGQKAKSVRIYNFLTKGTVEEYVQIVLTRKVKECQLVLGEFTSPLEIEKVYEDKMAMGIGNALMTSRDADDMRAKMNALKADGWRAYVGDYGTYEKETPQRWTWSPRG
jgi:SNF2 family DNA or RNA helicase